MTELVLNAGQQEGFKMFTHFYLQDTEWVMLLKGYSGTGKTTLVRHFLMELDTLNSMARLINPEFKPREIVLTATTNQAAEAFSTAIKGMMDVSTVYSKLGISVHRDHQTGKTKLYIRPGANKLENAILFIDEASYLDQEALSLIFKQIDNCKVVFMGDPDQFTPITSNFMPAFKMNSLSIELREVMRQNPGPLYELCMNLRLTVEENIWPQIKIDNDQLFHTDPVQFKEWMLKAFNEPEKFGRTKVLAYTNTKVMEYNNYLAKEILGSVEPQPGQTMMVNTAVMTDSKYQTSLKTGQEVILAGLKADVLEGIEGWHVTLTNIRGSYFMPKRIQDLKQRLKLARANEDFQIARQLDEMCVDLRPLFACTVNKSQGSTYDTVFIDLNDLCKKIRSGNALARALYVGFSRARWRVITTGDL